MRLRVDGACFAYSKADGRPYALPRAEYLRLLNDWMAGKAFFTGESLYGGVVTLRLGDICAVSDSPPAALIAAADDQADEEREDSLR